MADLLKISRFSSLVFQKKYKAAFEKDEEYVQPFAQADEIRVQYIPNEDIISNLLIRLYDRKKNTYTSVSPESLSNGLYQFALSGLAVGCYSLRFMYMSEVLNYSDFDVVEESALTDTVYVRYTNFRNEFGTQFISPEGYQIYFGFREVGGFISNDIAFEVDNDTFRDQRGTLHQLSQRPRYTEILTIGDGTGVSKWVGDKLNLMFALSEVYVDGKLYVRSEGSAPELMQLGDYHPLFVFKISLEPSDSVYVGEGETREGFFFKNAILADRTTPLLFDIDTVALYEQSPGEYGSGKLIRELELLAIDVPSNAFLAIDTGVGAAKKAPVSAIAGLFDDRYLRKDIDDTAFGTISFAKDIKSRYFIPGYDGQGWQITQAGLGTFDSLIVRHDIYLGGGIGSPDFISGFPNGIGWDLDFYKRINAAGVEEKKYRLEIDDVIVRGKLRVFEFIVSQLRGENDNVIFAGMMKVDHYDPESGRLYLQTDEGVLYNPFREGDILMMQRFGGMPSVANNYNVIKQYELRVTDAGVGNMADEEKRLDWITFSNFVGEIEDIAENDVLVRVDSVSDSTRKGVVKVTTIDEIGAPYIDVVYGMKTDPMNATKARLGNLTGIRTKNNRDLTGIWGLYAEGAVLENSTIYLENGDTIEQNFTVMNGRLNSEIEAIRNDISSAEGNILRNPSFSVDKNYWVSIDDISIINVGGDFLWFNSNFYADKRRVADIYRDGGRNVLRLLNTKIYQANEFFNFPAGAEEGVYSFSFFYKVIRSGTLSVGVPHTNLHQEVELAATSSYEKFVHNGEWNKEGDFEISFTGEILIYSAAMFTDVMAGAIAKLWTQIYQNEEQIALRATKEYVDAETGAIRQHMSTELSVMAEEIALRATKYYVDSETDRITNQWSSELSVRADQIEASVKQWTNNQLTNYSTLTQTQSMIGGVVADMTIAFDYFGNRIGAIESAGFLTTAQGNTLWAKKEMEDGNVLVSTINQTATTATIAFKNIDPSITGITEAFYKFSASRMYVNRRIEVGSGSQSSFVASAGIAPYDSNNISFWSGGTWEQAVARECAVLINHTGGGYFAKGNIIWTKEGDLTMRGLFESNNEGDKILIDPSVRRMRMVTSNGREVMRIGFTNVSVIENSHILMSYYQSGNLQQTVEITGSGITVKSNIPSVPGNIQITAYGIYKNGNLVV